MVDMNAWLGQGNEAISATNRAIDAWNRIQRNPVSITIVRGQSTLSAQSVRIEMDNDVTEISGDGAGDSAKRDGIVYGVKNHPTVADTNIQRGDRFALNGQQYKVIQIILVPGEIQAEIEVLS